MSPCLGEPEDAEPVVVVFRVGKEGEVFALFPGIKSTPWACLCYQHVGQHSSADYSACIGASRPATPEEYAPLKKELLQIGYVLKIRKRRPRNV